MKQSTAAFVVIIVLLCAAVVGVYGRHVILEVRLAHAERQIAIFEQMVDQAEDELSKSPPDVAQAVAMLKYVHEYYPSGTKQQAGSRLDKIVERTRALAERQIISMLRDVTEEDLAGDPEKWINKCDPR